jgi:alpha-2-macroglobulin
MKPAHTLLRTAFIMLSVIIFACYSCQKKYEPLATDPAFAAHVVSFSSGVISSASPIQVRLVKEVTDAEAGKELSKNPFSFSPDIRGKAVWVDKQTIRFVPEKSPEPGQVFDVKFALHQFTEVPKELRTLPFRFQIMKQFIRFDFEGISPHSENNLRWQQVHGVLYTADVANNTTIEQIVKVSGSKNLRWQHSKDGRTHHFTVDSVERKKKSYDIEIQWKGTRIGAADGSWKFQMPGLDQFRVLHVKTESAPKTSISVYFSDPLSKRQDDQGLFRLSAWSEFKTLIRGNEVQLIPSESVTGNVELTVFGAVRNIAEKTMGEDYRHLLRFISLKPRVEMIGEGVIVPDNKGILIPFKAVSLSAVEVRIIRIFENNIVQFLQVNQLNENFEIKRVGRIVYQGELQLTSDEPVDYSRWNNFSLDLSKLVQTEPGAIYRVELSFSKKHSLFPCGSEDIEDVSSAVSEEDNSYDQPHPYWNYWEDDGDFDYENYNWEEKNDPCKPSYYMGRDRIAARNVLASDLGIIAKAGTNNEFHVIVTDLRDTKPVSGVQLDFRNMQNQTIGKGSTNAEGFATVKLSSKPFVLVVSKEKQRGYLRLDDASSLSLSMFDVSGEQIKKGMKGFIYGERGVWRPGDKIHLGFILEDKNKVLPANHPVVLEFFNPQGQLAKRMVKTQHLNGFYTYTLETAADAPTGNWRVKISVGSTSFTRNIRIETVKPNRLKINLNYPRKIFLKNQPTTGTLEVNWLHGVPASGKKVKIEATMAATKTTFSGFNGYIFDDPLKSAASQDMVVFEGTLDAEGKRQITTRLNYETDAPGMMAVQLKTTAFEGGGDFSTDRAVFQYSPYKRYAGLGIPEGKGWNKSLISDETNLIALALVDETGKPLNGQVRIEIFNVYWRWWWEQSEEENLASYVSNRHSNLIKSDVISVNNGKGVYQMILDKNLWGRKLIRVTDMQGGHSAGAVFYTSGRDSWSNASVDNMGGAEMLMFRTSKSSCKVGEQLNVELPVTHEGRALVSIETGSKVLNHFWVDAKGKKPVFNFEITAEMAPNIYIHVTYIQAHNKGKNDLPIRMYGVQSVEVSDPATHLKPAIAVAPELKPQQKFNVKISESTGKAMTYTLAIVDEGLLDITRFSTPDPWKAFYAREALGVRTWDMYKFVAGAFTGKMAGLYAIGGDQYFDRKGKENTNRFKPVVIFSGPHHLKANASVNHQFEMPNYVGSVRVMVVAGQDGAYGSAEKAVPVRQSLMVLPTIPRVVSPTEEIEIPVTVFAMDNNARNVTVKMNLSKEFEISGPATQTVQFAKPGEKMVFFRMKVKNMVGDGKINITASAGNLSSSSETDLKIRYPNPPVTTSAIIEIEAGKTLNHELKAGGIPGTNSATVELSAFYPIGLEKRMQYLLQYPHGCIEQIVSAAFPQLFLGNLTDMTQVQKAAAESNVKACLDRLKQYQLTNGGFSYWPGQSKHVSSWGTSYAGHFMLEAQAKGYKLPGDLLNQWVVYQTKEATDWRPSRRNYSTDMEQAYRLYTLALAKKPAQSAMNLMRETAETDPAALWRLAGAYALSGKADIGWQIVYQLQRKATPLDDYGNTFGSFNRDNALIMETLVLLGRREQARPLMQDMASVLSSNEWLSTQTSAAMLLAVSKFAGSEKPEGNLKAQITINGKETPVNTPKMISRHDIPMAKTAKVSIRNSSATKIYVQVQSTGIPLIGNQENIAENLALKAEYVDMSGKSIDPAKLKQGTQFRAMITVKHPGIRMSYENLALTQMFPSGWEILNARMEEVRANYKDTDEADYEDIRDDRVLLYFNLEKAKSKTFTVLLQAAYPGKFYHPSVECEAMYDRSIRALTPGRWVEVVK